jgi:hypothetical protein
MSTLDDVHQERWRALVPDIPYAPDNGIPTFWRQHPELGSPLGAETQLDDGSVAQAFSGGVVIWDATTGARLAAA